MSQMTTNYLNPVSGWFEQVHGHHGRMLVDSGGVDALSNRQYFMFHEFSVAQDAVTAVKVVPTGDVIMRVFDIKIMSGSARVEIVAGGTEGTAFTNAVPIFPINNMSTAAPRTATTTMNNGGSVTGGTTMDLFLVDLSNQASGTNVGEGFSIGFPAGTYYIRITNTDNSTITGIVKALWEEI